MADDHLGVRQQREEVTAARQADRAGQDRRIAITGIR